MFPACIWIASQARNDDTAIAVIASLRSNPDKKQAAFEGGKRIFSQPSK